MVIRRAVWVPAAAVIAGVDFLAATLEFLAPDVSYHLRDRLAERNTAPGGPPHVSYRTRLEDRLELIAVVQFVTRFRRRERSGRRRQVVAAAADRLVALREELQRGNASDVDGVLQEAAAVLCDAERDAATGGIAADAIAPLRSRHAACGRAAAWSRGRTNEAASPTTPTPSGAPGGTIEDRRSSPFTGEAHEDDGALAHTDRGDAVR